MNVIINQGKTESYIVQRGIIMLSFNLDDELIDITLSNIEKNKSVVIICDNPYDSELGLCKLFFEKIKDNNLITNCTINNSSAIIIFNNLTFIKFMTIKDLKNSRGYQYRHKTIIYDKRGINDYI